MFTTLHHEYMTATYEEGLRRAEHRRVVAELGRARREQRRQIAAERPGTRRRLVLALPHRG